MQQNKAFCSWSGGKDSCLALYRAVQSGINTEFLFTMLTEDGQRSRSHGLKIEVIKRYAELLDMKYVYGKATWQDYENVFQEKMTYLETQGVNLGIFGDIDINDHREWVVNACQHTNIKVLHPLWQENRRKIIEEFINLGFKSIIVTVNTNYLPKEYLAKEFTKELITEFEDMGIDPCGENGEFHTAVIDGPLFNQPLMLAIKDKFKLDNYFILDLDLK